MFLLAVDAYSKWLESVRYMQRHLKQLKKKLHGLPVVVVSDIGKVFMSDEFEVFLKRNGIKHLKTPPCHPASNGQVERVVQVFKEPMKKSSPNGL